MSGPGVLEGGLRHRQSVAWLGFGDADDDEDHDEDGDEDEDRHRRSPWWGQWWGWWWASVLKSGMLAVFGSRSFSHTERNRRFGNIISQKPRATCSCAAEEGVWVRHAAAASSSTSSCWGAAAPATASATIAILPSRCLASTWTLGCTKDFDRSITHGNI